MQTIIAFCRGVAEFRSGCTWADPRGGYTELDEAYDRGREFAHRVTLRRWDT